jgi:SAM-dependent methyltransferase
MLNQTLFDKLEKIHHKPTAYQYYTTPELWCDPYVSKQMLNLHLSENVELASRKKKFIDKSINWIVEYFGINHNSTVCDFGCGPGLYTLPLAQKGATVTGIDFSKTSINYAKAQAKRNNLSIDYLLKDYLKFEPTKTFDLVTMIYCDFCVLNPIQRANLLKRFYDCVDKNGFLLMDVGSKTLYESREPSFTIESSEKDGFWSPNPYYVFHNTFKYDAESLLLDKFTIIEQSKTRQNFNWFKCFDRETIALELQQHGFKVIDYFSNVAGDSYDTKSAEIALVAKKI